MRMLLPLSCFAALIAVGLAWLSFVQVPRADQQAQLLRQSAVKGQFGTIGCRALPLLHERRG